MRWPVLFLFLALGAAGASDEAPPLSRTDVLGWPRARADRFGCFLETELGHRDRRFNCALKDYVNAGDPCRKVEAWTEGPAFPADKVKLVHPLIRDIHLSWEHGELQAVWIIFERKLDPRTIRRELGLPDREGSPRPNVTSLDLGDCGTGSTCLYLEGFDHMGAGEADCGSVK